MKDFENNYSLNIERHENKRIPFLNNEWHELDEWRSHHEPKQHGRDARKIVGNF